MLAVRSSEACCGSCIGCRDGRTGRWNAGVRNCTRAGESGSRYLSSAVGVVYGTIQKLAIRKEILQAVGEQYEVSVSAVDSGIRRMVDQLEARPTAEWLAFKEKSGFTDEKPTTGKLIYAVKNYLQHQKGG